MTGMTGKAFQDDTRRSFGLREPADAGGGVRGGGAA